MPIVVRRLVLVGLLWVGWCWVVGWLVAMMRSGPRLGCVVVGQLIPSFEGFRLLMAPGLFVGLGVC